MLGKYHNKEYLRSWDRRMIQKPIQADYKTLQEKKKKTLKNFAGRAC